MTKEKAINSQGESKLSTGTACLPQQGLSYQTHMTSFTSALMACMSRLQLCYLTQVCKLPVSQCTFYSTATRKRALLYNQVGGKKPQTCLSVCEVVLAQLLPQQTVLGKKPQLRTHLAQADQVPAVRQALHDVELQAGRQVGQHHASS